MYLIYLKEYGNSTQQYTFFPIPLTEKLWVQCHLMECYELLFLSLKVVKIAQEASMVYSSNSMPYWRHPSGGIISEILTVI